MLIQSLEEQSLEQLTIDSFGGACQVTFMCVPAPALFRDMGWFYYMVLVKTRGLVIVLLECTLQSVHTVQEVCESSYQVFF